MMAINLVMNANKSRKMNAETSFTYAIVLTKIDKSNVKSIRALKKDILDTISMYEDEDIDEMDVKIIKTSSVTREGRDAVWTMLGDKIFLQSN